MLFYFQPTGQADVPESTVTHKVVAVCHIAALHHSRHHSQHFLQSRTSDVRRMKKRIKQVRRPRSWKVSYGDVFTAYCLLTCCYVQSWFDRLIHDLSSLQHKYIHTCPLYLYFPSFRFRFRDSQEHLWTECPVLLWKHLFCFQQVVDSRRMAAGFIEPAMGELGQDHGGLEAVRGSELNV